MKPRRRIRPSLLQPTMSPLPEYDTYLSLSFPSLAAFLASEAHLSVVSSAARRSNSLLVSVKTTSSSTSTCSSSSASSSSSSRAPPAADTYVDADAAPSSLWLPLERALASIYSCATREFLHSSRVLARVDVVVDHVRQLALCPPRTSPDIITWDASEASAAPATSPRPRPEAPDRIARHRDSYEVVALGGTFDHLHAGHKILLTMACSIATRKIIVGVSGTSWHIISQRLLLFLSLTKQSKTPTRAQTINCWARSDSVSTSNPYLRGSNRCERSSSSSDRQLSTKSSPSR